jgi:hypothetical protein
LNQNRDVDTKTAQLLVCSATAGADASSASSIGNFKRLRSLMFTDGLHLASELVKSRLQINFCLVNKAPTAVPHSGILKLSRIPSRLFVIFVRHRDKTKSFINFIARSSRQCNGQVTVRSDCRQVIQSSNLFQCSLSSAGPPCFGLRDRGRVSLLTQQIF